MSRKVPQLSILAVMSRLAAEILGFTSFYDSNGKAFEHTIISQVLGHAVRTDKRQSKLSLLHWYDIDGGIHGTPSFVVYRLLQYLVIMAVCVPPCGKIIVA